MPKLFSISNVFMPILIRATKKIVCFCLPEFGAPWEAIFFGGGGLQSCLLGISISAPFRKKKKSLLVPTRFYKSKQ